MWAVCFVFKKNRILRAMCEFSVWFLCIFVCVTESLSEIQQWNIHVCSYGQIYFFLGFWATSSHGRKGIKEVTKELLGVKSQLCVCIFKLLILKNFKHTQRENGKINSCVFIPILITLFVFNSN